MSNLTMSEQDAMVVAKKTLEYVGCREIIRSGKGFCGGYGDNPYFDGMRLPADAYEHIVEHMAHMAFLSLMMERHFPQIIPPQWAHRMMILALTHDIPEHQNGDKANDGKNKQHEDVEIERQVMRSFVQGVDFGSHPSIYCDYLALERVTGLPMLDPTEDEIFGQTAYTMDKSTAIFELAYSESKGIVPTLIYKLRHHDGISERDEFYMKVTESNKALDVWMAHAYDFCKSYSCFWAFRLVTEAVYQEVRGHLPNWTHKILENPLVRLWPANKD